MKLVLYINSCHFHLYLTCLQLAIKHAGISDRLLITANKCCGGLRMGGLLQAHTAAWICMHPGILELCPPLTERSIAAFLLRGARCCYHGAAAAEALHAVALSACLLGAVTFSLFSTGPGEAAELLVQREAITGAADIMSVTATDWCSEVQPETRLQLKQNPCKVNPAFEEHLKTIWYYS